MSETPNDRPARPAHRSGPARLPADRTVHRPSSGPSGHPPAVDGSGAPDPLPRRPLFHRPSRTTAFVLAGVAAVAAVIALAAVLATHAGLGGSPGSVSSGGSGQLDPPAGFLPDMTLVGAGTTLKLGGGEFDAINVELPADADILGGFSSTSPVSLCVVNLTANSAFGSGGSDFGSTASLPGWSSSSCEWNSGPTTSNDSFDAYVVGGSTSVVFFNSGSGPTATISVSSEIFATFDEY